MNFISKIIMVLLLTSCVSVFANALTTANPLAVRHVTDQGFSHENFPPMNVIDGRLTWASRWASSASPSNIALDFGNVKRVTKVGVSWGLGHQRQFVFEIWTRKYTIGRWVKVFDGISSGTTSDIEVYDIVDIDAQQVRVKTFQNSADSDWTDIQEIEVYGDQYGRVSDENLDNKTNELKIIAVSDNGTSHRQHPVTNAVDGNGDWTSRWSAHNGINAVNLTLEIDKVTPVNEIGVSWGKGDSVKYTFEIYAREGVRGSWTKVYTGVSSGEKATLEKYTIPEFNAKQVRVKVRYNNVESEWTHITQVKIYGKSNKDH